MCGVRNVPNDDGDVTGPLQDPAGAPLGARAEPLEGRALVGVHLGDEQVVLVEALTVALGLEPGVGESNQGCSGN